jgi:hypothetical protein
MNLNIQSFLHISLFSRKKKINIFPHTIESGVLPDVSQIAELVLICRACPDLG